MSGIFDDNEQDLSRARQRLAETLESGTQQDGASAIAAVIPDQQNTVVRMAAGEVGDADHHDYVPPMAGNALGTSRTVGPISATGLPSGYSSADINGLLTGYAWNTGAPLTYSFPTSASQYGNYSDPSHPEDFFLPLLASQQTVVRYALGLVAKYTGLTFTELTGANAANARLRFAASGDTVDVPTSYGNFPGTFDTSGDVWFGNIRNTNIANSILGADVSYAFDTILHEIGHALGLKHGQAAFNGFPTLPSGHNNGQYSLMDYHQYENGPQYFSAADGSGHLTYMVNDIAALQYLYGANYNTNSGNTIYKWNASSGQLFINNNGQTYSSTNTIYESVWDGGGIDTYDLSDYTTNVFINLSPGAWSTFSTAQLARLDVSNSSIRAVGNVVNALLYQGNAASLIENAIGGSGNDTLYGNFGDNIFRGGLGNDYIYGNGGYDTVSYADATSGLTIVMAYTQGNQVVGGGVGLDTLVDIDAIIGGDYDDNITGYNTSAIYGGKGNDTLSGASTLDGGDGDDILSNGTTLIGGAGNDTLIDGTTLDGGSGNDTAIFNTNSDITLSFAVTGAQANGRSVVSIENISAGGGNDTLTGDGNDNVLSGGGGNDTLSGGGGNDTLNGGNGNDILTGDTGNDTLDGGSGIDTAIYSDATSGVTVNLALTGPQSVGGGRGTDTLASIENLTGSSFNDTLTADGNDNILVGGGGDDSLSGGNGNDTLIGGAGNDTLDGGGGIDTASYADATSGVTVSLAVSGAQAVGGGRGTDTLIAVENLIGGDFNDTLTGNGSDNVLNGGSGDDLLTGGAGNDTLTGGSGTDTASYADATSGVTVNLNSTVSQAVGGGLGSDTLSSIENLIGGNYNDTLTGDGNNNSLTGGDGNDTLSGSAGADTLNGGDGDDQLTGGTGNDILVGGAGVDTTYYTGRRSDYEIIINAVTGEASIRDLRSGTPDGWDTLTNVEYAVFSDQTMALAGVVFNGTSGNDTFTGTQFGDFFNLGQGGNDTANGGDGDDVFNLGAMFDANDRIDGGNGSDTLNLSGDYSAQLTITGAMLTSVETIGLAAGKNYSLKYTAGGTALLVNATGLGASNTLIFDGGGSLTNFTINGGAGDDVLTGGAGNDALYGNGGNNILRGGKGDDLLAGSGTAAYDDAIGDVQVSLALANVAQNVGGGLGTDTLLSSVTGLLGGSFNDTLTGNSDANVLSGGDGDDVLRGGGGNDTLYGGTGMDLAVFAGPASSYQISSISGGYQAVDNGSGSSEGTDLLYGIEFARFGDTVVSLSSGSALNGNSVGGNMSGSAFADYFYITANNYDVRGLGGDDYFWLGSGYNTIVDGGDDYDTVRLNDQTVYLDGNQYKNVERFVLGGASCNITAYANFAVGLSTFLDGNSAASLVFDGTQAGGTFSVRGSAGNDALTGSAGADTFDLTLGGNDIVNGGDGNDTFNFGARFAAGDQITGGGGTDVLNLNGDYSTRLTINTAMLYGVGQIDLAAGNNYNLKMDSFTGPIAINAGALGASNSLTFDGSQSTATFTITGGAGDDIIVGGAGVNNFMLAGGGSDTVTGFGTYNLYYFGASFGTGDKITGNPNGFVGGLDHVHLEGDYSSQLIITGAMATNVEIFSLLSGFNYNLKLDGSFLVGPRVDFQADLLGSANNLTFDGSLATGVVVLTGGAGNDVLVGGNYNDNMWLGRGGNDTVVGGAGDDGFNFEGAFTADDVIDGGTNQSGDQVFLSGDYSAGVAFNATTMVNIEALSLGHGSSSNNNYNLTLNAATVKAGERMQISGSFLTALESMRVDASAVLGAVSFSTGLGDDTLIGGAGNDLFSILGGNDVVDGGGGLHNLLTFAESVTTGLTVNLGQAGVQATGIGSLTLSNIQDIAGSRFDDILTGSAAANAINGRGGNDRLEAGAGDDYVVIGGLDGAGQLATDARVDGGADTDTLTFYAVPALVFVQGVGNVTLSSGVTFNLANTAAQNTGVGTVTAVNFENVVGTRLADTITGDDGNNTLYGADGNDTLNGGAGNDTLYGDKAYVYLFPTNLADGWASLPVLRDAVAPGDDILSGGAGDDTLDGGAGNDTLYGGVANGNDTVAGNDILIGGAGSDTLVGSTAAGSTAKASYIDATGGVNVSLAISGAQAVGGGLGSDTLINITGLIGSSFNDTLTAGAAGATLEGGAGNDTLNGGIGNDSLSGGDGEDKIYGGDGNDTLYGGINNDELIGGAGDDTIIGGAGTDTASYEDATSGVTVSLAITGPQAVGGGRGSDTLVEIEALKGSAYNDILIAGDGGSTLFGSGGDDILISGAGLDGLYGGAGNDTASYEKSTGGVTVSLAYSGIQSVGGGLGDDFLQGIENLRGGDFNDSLIGDGNANILAGGNGDDVLNGGDGNDTLYGGNVGGGDTVAGNDILIGGLGNDTLVGSAAAGSTAIASYSDAASGVTVSLAISGPQAVGGGLGNDTLINITGLVGSDYNDTLSSGSGSVSLNGGVGDDTFNLGASFSAGDRINGGTGNDTLNLAGDYSTELSITSDMLLSVERINLAAGSNYNLKFTSTFTPNNSTTVDASALGTSSTFTLSGSAAGTQFIVTGGRGNNVLSGGGYADQFTVTGSIGSLAINGGGGDDVISLDNTRLTSSSRIDGGTGSDTLVLRSTDYSSQLLITGAMVSNVEQIALSAGNSYNLKLDSSFTASGTFVLGGRYLDVGNNVTFDGWAFTGPISAETGGGADTLVGGAGADFLNGGGGNDILTGGGGNDTLRGSDGFDTARYSGLITDYEITTLVPGYSVQVKDRRGGSPDGTDTLLEVERLQWGDGSYFTLFGLAPPSFTTTNVQSPAGQTLALSSLVTPGSGNPAIKYQLRDKTADARSGHFVVNGVEQAANTVIEITAAQFAQTNFVTGRVSDNLEIRAFDGMDWAPVNNAWSQFSVTNVNGAPVVTTANLRRTVGLPAAASTLFSVNDVDGDTMALYQFWDSTADANSGYFISNGSPQPANFEITVTAAQLSQATFVMGSVADNLWVRAFDGKGAWSNWSSFNLSPNRTPAVTTANITRGTNQTLAASSLFSVSDPDGDAMTTYQFWDSTTNAQSGYFVVGGITQQAETTINVSAAQLSQTSFVTGTMGDNLWVRTFDGTDWGAWSEFNLTAQTVNRAPIVTTSNRTPVAGSTLALSSLFSVSDADGDTMTSYELWDDVSASSQTGSFKINGVSQAAGTTITVSAAQLSQTSFVAGTAPDNLWIRAYDGKTWSNWSSFTVTPSVPVTNAAPVVTTSNRTPVAGSTLALSSLFSVSDADGDTMTSYELWDDVSASSQTGSFKINGVSQAAGTTITVSAAQLSQTSFVAGTAPDNLWIRAYDGKTWSNWSSFTVTPSVPATNRAPFVTTSNVSRLANLTLPASSLFSVSDPDGNAITSYEFWDSTPDAQSGRFVVGGVNQQANTTISVSAGQLSQTSFVTGTVTDDLWVRVFDGTDWSSWSQFNVVPRTTNTAPATTAANLTRSAGQTLAASSLFSASDADGDAMTAYQFWDSTPDAQSGRFVVGGVNQQANANIDVLASQLSQTSFVTGTMTDSLWVRAFDGASWSAWSAFSVGPS